MASVAGAITHFIYLNIKKVAKLEFEYSAPAGLHDDCVIALAMAWDACSRMNGSEAILIPAPDPRDEILKLVYIG